jgi:SAM-dependent methyltransferase
MAQSEAKRWDERYRRERTQWLERKPRRLLTNFTHLLPTEGRALDAAGGVCACGLYLARRGLRVFALDISEFALHLAMERAQTDNLSFHAAVYDLSILWLPPGFFSVILNFHFLERAAIPIFRQALIPGGLIFFETFVRVGEFQDTPGYYLEPGELLSYFKDFEIIHYSEDPHKSKESHAERGLAQLIARRPESELYS